ncbi:cytochrome-c peroxidase [Ameyamaea chiangmaiensis]|uniref:Heme-binding domain-containing protein n=1 Tax=Ameyamaea chiangmaiensis TaxID=442969 RepID=A0A850P7N9_9PROT|nr:cytochrome-c peroxidase [Ameyamaea chiangmaiensis]MBS4073855.1 cytochrome-c peroxidase [Ameyamaea chiangmaiensis]NVN40617.1 heme-binding domain-containing protein [Ameyamaea chiangmaiensis]
MIGKLLGGLAVAGAVAYGGVVAYLTHFDHAGAPELSVSSPTRHDPVALAAFNVLREARCDYCHAAHTTLPFYFHLPVARQLMASDLQSGLRHFRVEPVLAAFEAGTAPSVEQLSRIEEVINQNRMPPTLYLLMHWHAYLDEAQRHAVIDWINQTRRTHYATPGVAASFAAEPVQPIPESVAVNEAQAALGKRLFFEKALSGDGTLSCASCHALNKGGVDNLVTADGIHHQRGPINVPSVFDSGFNASQFWDGRAATLADQAAGPVMNPVEMGSHDWAGVADRVRTDPSYVAAFQSAFGNDTIDRTTITTAIAEYEKTLITPDSRFDLYLKGDAGAITAQEKRGYDLFKSVGCSGCHSGVAMGGQAYEAMGLEGPYFDDRHAAYQKVDNGRQNVTGEASDHNRFKVPNLRNVALTGPYFHDGSATTLEQAVRAMARYQTPDHAISDRDVTDIVAFLKTLTGKYQGTPLDQISAP